jgi:hypothetical protein
VLDAVSGPRRPPSFLVGSLVPVIEALMVVVVLATALAGAALKSSTNLFGASPTSYAVVVFWVAGVWVVNRVRMPAWVGEAPEATPGRRHPREPIPGRVHPYTGVRTAVVAGISLAGALVTLAVSCCRMPVICSRTASGSRVRSSARPSSRLQRHCRRSRAASGIAAAAIVARPRRTFFWLGLDSLAMLAIYAAGIACSRRW